VAIRLSRRIKLGVVAPAALSTALLLIPAVAFATPQTPKTPTVGTVQQQLSRLALQNTLLIEQFDQAQVDVQARQAAADAALKIAQIAQAAVDKAILLLGATATAQYENGSFSTAGALLSSDSGQSYLDQLQTLQAMSTHTAQVIAQVSQDKALADAASRRASDLLKQATAKRNAVLRQRAIVQRQVDAYTNLLATMSVTQQIAYQQLVTPSVSNAQADALIASLKATPATTRAIKAVKFALAQVGKPYVYATAGPDTYDCSGLTMASWAVAGVSLPHSSEEQYTMGTPVSVSQLQPGDLLFFYGPPPGHVTIYVGGGLMVSAPQPGENVLIARLSEYNGSYVGARRVG
jgi:cell wall-associated NlpC family hydrolase